LRVQSFENVKNQIGYCGIWCGSCVVGNGALRNLTKGYERIVKAYDLEGWALRDFDFREFMKGIASIQAMPLCRGCGKGGGRTDCEMRECASGKGISDCSECDAPKVCRSIHVLKHMRTGALGAGLSVKTKKGDRRKLIRKWTGEVKAKWPSRVLFSQDR